MSKSKKQKPEHVELGGSIPCELCSDLTYGDMNCACGRWFENRKPENGRPDVMIVGEAPGETEVDLKKFFVGPAGNKLYRWIDAAGLDKHYVYLDNVIRCGPVLDLAQMTTQKRKRMIKNCAVYLGREIERLNPKVIIGLGGTALNALTGLSGITGYQGKAMLLRSANAWFMPTFHPAFVLRGGGSDDICIQDFIKVRSLIRKSSNPRKPETVFVDTNDKAHELIERLRVASEFAIDSETGNYLGNGALNPFADGTFILCLSFAFGDKCGYCVPVADYDLDEGEGIWKGGTKSAIWKRCGKRILSLIEKRKKLKIYHNAAFDAKWFRVHFGIDGFPCFDTLIAMARVNPGGDNGLKPLSYVYTNFGGYEDDKAGYMTPSEVRKYGFMKVPPLRLGRYAALDAVASWIIKKYLVGRIGELGIEELIRTHMDFRRELTEMEISGIKLSMPHVRKIAVRMENQIDEFRRSLINLIGDENINLNSSKQLISAFYDFGGLFWKEYRKYGIRSTSKKALAKLRGRVRDTRVRVLDQFTEWRTVSKLLSTYIRPFLKSDGRLHTNFSQSSTRTGRTSSRSPNLQNASRRPEIRGSFISEPDRYLIEADYSQVELRIGAEYSGDENMLNILSARDGDIHSFVGQGTIRKANGAKYERDIFIHEKEMRARAKIVSFSIAYGKTAVGLAEDLGITAREAEDIIRLLLQETFPGLGAWIEEQHYFVERYGYVETLFGCRIPIQMYGRDRGDYGSAHRKAVNYPIQCAASDCAVIGFTRALKRIKKERLDAFGVLTVHDSLMVSAHKSCWLETATVMREEMERPIEQLERVQLFVDIAKGTRWSDLKEIPISKLLRGVA